MTRIVLIFFFLVATHAAGLPLSAQDEPLREGVFLRLGGGVGQTTSRSSDGSHLSRVAPFADVHFGIGGRRVQALIEMHWQPFEQPVPQSGNQIRLMYSLASVQVFLNRSVYVRGGVGGAHLTWSGSGGGGSENNFAAGLALGVETRVLGRWVAFEAVSRSSFSLCFDQCGFTGTRFLGVQVLLPFY